MTTVPPTIVLADDRTGACETAAAIAERAGSPVPVVVATGAGVAWPKPGDSAAVVVDIGTRHRSTHDAACVVDAVLAGVTGAVALKIDSTLRGNWAVELAAAMTATGRRGSVLAALPGLGRVCRDGVVTVDGVPVADGAAGHDPRRPVGSSRPADHLAAAGVEALVIDAETDADLDREGRRWAAEQRGRVFAGTSAAVAAAVTPTLRAERGTGTGAHLASGPALVVCGSAHPRAQSQIDYALAAGALGRDAVVRLQPPQRRVDDAEATAAVRALVAEARARLAARSWAAVVVLGGDTAAALLGDGLAVAFGVPMIGHALVRSDALHVPVITRAGGFGGAGSLADLLTMIDGQPLVGDVEGWQR